MKKKFLKIFAAVAMIFSFAGFIRAEEQGEATDTKPAKPTFSTVKPGAEADTLIVFKTEDVDSIFVAMGRDSSAAVTNGYTKYLKNDTIALTQDTVVLAYAVEGAEKVHSDTALYAYTKTPAITEPTKPAAPEFEKITGAEADTLVVKKGEADSIFVAMGRDSSAAVTNGYTKYLKNDTIALTQDTVVLAYAVKGEVHSDTVKHVYTKTTVPEPIVVVAPKIDTIKKLDGKDSAVVVVFDAEKADDIFVATGKTLAEATTFTQYTKNDTIVLTQDTVVRACAVKNEVHSDTVTYVYTKPTVTEPEPIVVAAPKIDTIKGLDSKDSVVIVKLAADAEVYVATGKDLASATEFTKISKNDTIVLSQDTVVRAYAVKDEVHSDTVAYVYTKPTVTPDPEEPEKVAVPTFETKAGAEADTIVVLLGEADSIFVAKAKDTVSAYAASFVKYTEDAKIIADQDTLVFIAYAVKEEVHSDTVAYRYIKATVTPDPEEPEKVAVPVIDTIKGQDKADSVVIVKFDATKADSIFVATGKNLAAATAFAKFTKNDTIVLSQDTAVRAYAMKDGKYSDTVRYIYTATVTPEPEKDTVATPVFSLKGEVNKGDTLYITCATEGAEIFYALDTVKFVKYENGIEITEDVTVKAFAKKGEIVSDTVEVSLTVKTQANEGKELSGVSIYPNPSNGEFKVAVPVNATVELFNTNGQMVRRANLVAGVNTLRMNNSGIYFVRFTAANGQVVIKKVIVR